MTSPIIIPFTKAEALGNDFVIIRQSDTKDLIPKALSQSIADRRYGVGCDQVLLYQDHHVEFINADGSLAEACGNGSRAFALFLAHQKKLDHIIFQAGSSSISASVTLTSDYEGSVTLSLDDPKFLMLQESFIEDVLWLLNDNVIATFHVSTGNPHLVIFVKYFDDAQFSIVAPQLAASTDFPRGINVTFASITDQDLHIHVLERGAGRTPACGTAAFASAFAATNASLLSTDGDINVHQQGGSLTFYKRQNWHMRGPARICFNGQYFYHP